ncbi:xanthine dehydrogenase accessory factor [Extensimonas vulgaris]|uniref:Xanthine dehydrogenase accessory factor n=2 Tax=Extensimonas vulgaris TaxID=1031594 RepID=A0A369AJ38_9BURK|nr:xanthine dehydrogenase accessory factor [Extensimonas vulgaris]TWI38523.1 xanthine dehydrogenase accessory factor [Extensimonas vulgaris]
MGTLEMEMAELRNLQVLWSTLAAGQAACLVRVESIQGSAPREAGAWMLVFAAQVFGSIGGGHLEHQAIAQARRLLAARGVPGAPDGDARASDTPLRLHYALGPALGQCCGGAVELGFVLVGSADVPALKLRLAPRRHPLALFGAGHVGRALVQVLAPLPFAVRWFDSREDAFPAQPCDAPMLPEEALRCEHSEPVHGAVASLAPGTRVLIMSFSHAEDFALVHACLRRQRARGDLPFIGLIGSRTKWATFASRLRARGFAEHELAHITCPIGVPGIRGKEPAVIAVAVAAQLLQTLTPQGSEA